MFDSVKNFLNRTDKQSAEKNKLENEAKNFKLPGEAGPQIVKYAVFIGLAFLNFRLFSELVPGPRGIATGVVAIVSEYLALYSFHNFSRSAGAFRVVLGLSGVALAAFSITHGAFSFFDMVGVAELGPTIHWYSRMVAFPLLAALVAVSSIAMGLTHPVNLVRLKQAFAHTQIATGRAQAASELELMKAQAVIEQAKLDNQKERIRRESEYLESLGSLIAVEQKKRDMVAAIPDPELREALARELGIEVPKSATSPSSPASKSSAVPIVSPAPQTSNWARPGNGKSGGALD